MYGHQVFPLLEGIVSTQAGTSQRAALWVEAVKKVMLSDVLKSKDDWQFLAVADVDESASAAMIEAATSRVYGLLVGQLSADSGGDFVAILDDASGGYTFDGTAALDNTFRAVHYIPATATDLVEEFWGFIYPDGIAITNDLMVAADGSAGTNPATDDIRVWVLYRTINTE